jgi:hypothetical protein
MINYLPIPESAARQLIDSSTVFTEFNRVLLESKKYAGSMYWKSENGYDYLIKTKPKSRKQERLGPRSEASENIFSEYTARKIYIENRLSSLEFLQNRSERLSVASRRNGETGVY